MSVLIMEKSYIKLGFLMIDTPLLRFDEDESKSETLKIGLYQYFINHQGDGQVIIVDNLNVIPDIDFEGLRVKVTIYYKMKEMVMPMYFYQVGKKIFCWQNNEIII